MDDITITLLTLIGILCLILIFSIAANIYVIKKAVCKEFLVKDYYDSYLEEKYIGNMAKAKEYLLRACYQTETNNMISQNKKMNFYKNTRKN
mgnify:CR=1 FL=1